MLITQFTQIRPSDSFCGVGSDILREQNSGPEIIVVFCFKFLNKKTKRKNATHYFCVLHASDIARLRRRLSHMRKTPLEIHKFVSHPKVSY
jgi:hypothetical protein